MRTTVEMKPEHRSALLSLAARRGEKGFSSVLAEAIDSFLDEERSRSLRRKELLSVAGTLPAQEARNLRSSTRAVRENWR
ncbi:MAG: hypothetical protein ACRD2U_11940 [Terriglobales bacterium]